MKEQNETLAQSPWATVTKRTIGTAEYLMMATGPAACVLPFDKHGNLYFIKQLREESNGAMFWKTVGGYLRNGETHEQCVTRNLADKAGIAATEFTEISRTFGYGDVIKVPIQLYFCEPGKWKHTHRGSCELVSLSCAEAVAAISDYRWLDDATRLLILLFAVNRV